MAGSRKPPESKVIKRPPATTPEGRENQLTSLAFDLAEKQLSEGTASAQVITFYLRTGSATHKLEREKLQQENELLKAKIAGMASAERVEKLYDKAIRAMRGYAGQDDEEELFED